MFPGEPEQRPETIAERDRRRAAAGTDRRGLKHVVITMVILFGGMASIYAADVVGVDRRRTTATVVGFIDRRSNHMPRCVTQLTTGYGDTEIYTRDFCRNARWHIGDQAEVEARQLRFTGIITVYTRGTLFDGASSMLPQS